MSDRHRYREDREDYDRRGGGGYRDHRGGGGGYGRGGGGGQYRERQHRGGGGGGYHGGGDRGRQQQRFQASYVGQKRGRDEPEALDPKKQFITRLMKLGQPGPLSDGDKTNSGDTPEKTIENALWAFKQEIKHKTENLTDIMLEAVVSCSHKTIHYALLLGLLHSENPDWVGEFIAAGGRRFEAELAAGDVDGPRLLLRFFACLSLTKVLHHADVLGLLQRLVEVAQQHAAAGADPTGLTWQPWTDQLVYMVLGAAVWGGTGLAQHQVEQALLLEAVSSYMAARPIQESVELRPLYGASDASDASAASDSGGASFLGQLWDAVQVLRDPEQDWHVEGIPSELLGAFSAKLTGQPVELPPIQLPTGAVPGVPADAGQLGAVERAQAALLLQDRYQPRGGMVILDSQYTDAGRNAAERFVAEEYMIDLLGAFDSHRVELVQMLCSGLPLPYDYSGLLCETLFAQLLRLPAPRLSAVAFSALIAHAALLRPAFPKYLAGSVRQLYLRLQFLAPELTGRLADVLAHFVTNMNFRWPWDRYRMGLTQPPGGPQRTFLVLVLQHLVRLTSWDHQLLLQETPADFLALLGEPPHFSGLPVPEPYPPPPKPPALPPASKQQDAAPAGGDGDAAMADADQAAAADKPSELDGQQQDGAAAADTGMQLAEQNEGAEEQLGKEQQQLQQQAGDADQQMTEASGQQLEQQQQAEEPADPEMLWAGKLLGVMQARLPPERKPLTYEQVVEWIDQQKMRDAVGSPEAMLRAVGRAVLAAGSKSYSHCYVLIERYSPLLYNLMDEVGAEAGQRLLLELLGDMYSQMTQRLSLALARFNEVSLLSPAISVTWLAASPQLQFGPALHDAAASDAWQLLHSILAGTFARYDGAIEHKARLEDGVRQAQAKLKAASDESAAAVEAQQQAEDAAQGDVAADAGGGSAAKRQRIEWSAGRDGRSGPVHRAEVAALREQVMVKKLAAAEQALVDQQVLIQKLQEARGTTLLLAFQGLTRRLLEALAATTQQAADAEAQAVAAAPAQEAHTEQQEGQELQEHPLAAAEAAADAAAQAEAARRLCLAQMHGFSLMYRSQVVQLQLADQLLQHVDALAVDDVDVRAAILGPLHLA